MGEGLERPVRKKVGRLSRRAKWLLAIATAALILVIALVIAGYVVANRFEPYVRAQVILYLQDRFDSQAEISSLRIRMPRASLLHTFFTRGRGMIATVEGDGVVLRHRGRRDVPPIFSMKDFRFDVDLGTVFDPVKVVHLVTIDGMQINVPPAGERPDLGSNDNATPPAGDAAAAEETSDVRLEQVVITNAGLTILPKDKKKVPLRFDIHRLQLSYAGRNTGMKYDADLTNAKPPGDIISTGTFGPWNADEPGDSPLTGSYTFKNADLGVFPAIGGMLESSGQFEGTLSAVNARGEATVPDFRLKQSGNRVPLRTRFEVRVDGTNGDTVLKPVTGAIGSTSFTTSGGIIKHENDLTRTISLNVSIPSGNIRDLLALAMKGPPFMEGKVALKTKIDIPPLSSRVREKLLLDGQFEVSQGRFFKSTVQDQLRCRSIRHVRSRQGYARSPRHTETAGQSVSNDDGMEAVGVEAGGSVLCETGSGDAASHPDRRYVEGTEIRTRPRGRQGDQIDGADLRPYDAATSCIRPLAGAIPPPLSRTNAGARRDRKLPTQP
jgi:hypothetical protein